MYLQFKQILIDRIRDSHNRNFFSYFLVIYAMLRLEIHIKS